MNEFERDEEASDLVTYSELQVKAIQGLCNELSGSMTRTEGERDFQKEAVAAVSKEHEIPKAMLKKMARIFHKSKFSTVQEENAELEATYKAVFGEQAL
jgi:hypothetical protein